MIKRLLILLLLSAPVFGGGPKYSFDDPKMNDEFNNNYFEHSFPNWINAKGSSETLKYLNVSTITLNGANLTTSAAFYDLVTTSKSAVSFATTSLTYVATPLSKNYSSHFVGNTIRITVTGNLQASNPGSSVTYGTIFKASTDLCDLGLNVRGCALTTGGASTALDVPMSMTVIDISTTTSPVNYIFKLKTDGLTGTLNNNSSFSQMLIEESGS